MRRSWALVAILVALLASSAASAHIERPAYWPNPAPERVGGVPVGGKFPKARSLASALRAKPIGETRVVCKRSSRRRLGRSIRRARRRGYDVRPTVHRSLSRKRARRLRAINRKLWERCEFRNIQAAVNKSRNHDRVVVMPGLYRERPSRRKPSPDPSCDQYTISADPPSRGQANPYIGEFKCPHDANLIAIMGRRPGRGEDPDPPRWNRHGIPNLGRCIRCDLQLEGSGVSADDVIVEAGSAKAGNRGPNGVGAKKDVGIRADRADGFVLRKMTVRHAAEHGIYVLESDGYLLDDFKVYYNGLYGTLTFAEDHGITQDCDGAGHGDSSIYPGAPVETGEQRPPGTKFRYNQIVRRCDMHHSMAGYSATNGNAVWVHHNNFYDNVLGFQTDVVTSPGHPGFPGDSHLIERNNFYSNNFNIYGEGSDVEPAFPFPQGTGMWIAGGNNNVVRFNRFWNNWRRGAMLFTVPDVLVCGPSTGNEQAGCNQAEHSTSYRNEFYGNMMGVNRSGALRPNGVDFWWDAYPGSSENCWYRNSGPGGSPVTTDPAIPGLPNCNNGSNPESSVGLGDPENEGELVACAVAFQTGDFDPDTSPCPWLDPAAKPESAAVRAARADEAARDERFRETFHDFCAEYSSNPTCEAYATRGTPSH